VSLLTDVDTGISGTGARFSKLLKLNLGLRFSLKKLKKNLGKFLILKSSLEKLRKKLRKFFLGGIPNLTSSLRNNLGKT